MLKPLAIVLSMLSVASITAASGEDQAPLPTGHYIYLGSDANSNAPKAFTITPGGGVNWQGDSPSGTQPNTSNADMIFKGDVLNNKPPVTDSGKPGVPARNDLQGTKRGQRAAQTAPSIQPKMENIEKFDWPVIKFSPKPMPGSTDGFAQLTTTLETTASPYQGTVKYKLILLRAEPEYLTLQLLDGNGFMLHEFTVSPNNFQPISGTALVAARGTFSLKIAEYERARDFSLAGRTKTTPYSHSSQPSSYRPQY